MILCKYMQPPCAVDWSCISRCFRPVGLKPFNLNFNNLTILYKYIYTSIYKYLHTFIYIYIYNKNKQIQYIPIKLQYPINNNLFFPFNYSLNLFKLIHGFINDFEKRSSYQYAVKHQCNNAGLSLHIYKYI